MSLDPEALGRSAARLFVEQAPRLFDDLSDSGALGAADPETRSRARREWTCFALYACVRGLVAGAGFSTETARAIEVFHTAALPAASGGGDEAELRRLVSERYDEYGSIGQAGGAAGAATVPQRLGEAAARRMLGERATPQAAELIGHLHEALAEGVAAAMPTEEAHG